MSATIRIEVIYALTARQILKELYLESGATARVAVLGSRLPEEFPGIVIGTSQLACFGHLINWDTVLKDGDRIEVLRPLQADPKEARRRRAYAQAAGACTKKLR